jgi:acetate kinase
LAGVPMKYKGKTINILVLNCGSSSLKYKIINMPQEKTLVQGEAERVGIKTQETSVITHVACGRKIIIKTLLPDHSTALKSVLKLIVNDKKNNKDIKFDIFAHRYVHPGRFFTKPCVVNSPVLEKLKETLPLAAIHNPISYKLIKFCRDEYASINQYVVFDTAFHRTIPPQFSTYAMPIDVMKKYGLRRIGFHGISHRYVMEEACRFLGRDKATQRIISCHLGAGGSSICAILNGESVNNSMGFTPLEGLMMNTRCGNVDPGLLFYIMFKEFISPEETEKILNRKSGILGVFNTSSDLRDVINDIQGDKKAKMTFDMYVHRVRTYIGFYSLILKKADILVFTDSLGVELPVLRESVCDSMDFLGIAIDKEKNIKYKKGINDISLPASETRILVIPSDEEIMIAREAYKELMSNGINR